METPRFESQRFLADRDDSVLMVIDVQSKLTPVISEFPKLTANLVKLIRTARILDIPVLVTEQQNLGATADEIRADLEPFQPISKISFSCLGSTEVSDTLEDLGRSTLLLSGIEAHVCVFQTAIEAARRFRVQVVADAVSARDPRNLDIAIHRLRAADIAVTSTEMLMYEWLRRAGTDQFRATLPLLK
ncbi:MAG TPA: isochorismatase family protein [Desulfobacterales bacterium]